MKIEINQVELPLQYSDDNIITALANKLSCQENQILSWTIKRRSLDARPIRTAPVYSVVIEVELSSSYKPNFQGQDFTIIKESNLINEFPETTFSFRPVIVGAGVAGLMAAYYLAKSGAKPIILERGSKAEFRSVKVNNFWENGILDLNDNVLFGEGGAGLFSDGKLTTRSKDKGRIFDFYNILSLCKAPEETFINAEPHLGSDVLIKIIPSLRKHIESLGGTFFYNTPMTDLEISNDSITGVITDKLKFETKAVILATGHSARDVYELLSKKNIELEQKPFAVGIRLEIPQDQINTARYRKFKDHPSLEPASFKLTRLPEISCRPCYTFCMCPGGRVIACANENNRLTTNGMSYSNRNLKYGNAAFIVPVMPSDFKDCTGIYEDKALYGLNFQIKIEEAAFNAAGKDFSLPALMLEDFLLSKVSLTLPHDRSCPRSLAASFDEIFPDFILNTLRIQIPAMLSQLKGTQRADAIVYAPETRSSSPVRILRNDYGYSPSVKGLYPIGEGAGYSGGIVSSAIDGLKIAGYVALSAL